MTGTILPAVAIAAIAALEFYALHRGMNGAMLAAAVSAIAGIAGYKLRGLFARAAETKRKE